MMGKYLASNTTRTAQQLCMGTVYQNINIPTICVQRRKCIVVCLKVLSVVLPSLQSMAILTPPYSRTSLSSLPEDGQLSDIGQEMDLAPPIQCSR